MKGESAASTSLFTTGRSAAAGPGRAAVLATARRPAMSIRLLLLLLPLPAASVVLPLLP